MIQPGFQQVVRDIPVWFDGVPVEFVTVVSGNDLPEPAGDSLWRNHLATLPSTRLLIVLILNGLTRSCQFSRVSRKGFYP